MSGPNLSVKAIEDFRGLCYQGHQDFIDCTQFKAALSHGVKALQSRGVKDEGAALAQLVAQHVSPDLYREIFGASGAPRHQDLLKWIEAESTKIRTMTYGDPFIAGTFHPEEGLSGHLSQQKDYLFHILSQRDHQAYGTHQLILGPSDTDSHDHIPHNTFATFWDPAFGRSRSSNSENQTATTDYQYADVPSAPQSRPRCPGQTPPDPYAMPGGGYGLSGRVFLGREDIGPGHPYGMDHLPIDPFDPAFSPPRPNLTFHRNPEPAFTPTWPLDHLNVDEGSTHRVTPLGYQIEGREITVYRRDDEGNLTGEPLPIPVAQLPDGRMVASVSGHAVLDYAGDGRAKSDRPVDVVEITWDPTARDVGSTIQMQTYLGGNTLNAQALAGVNRRDLDGDGSKELIRRETRPQVFANRSVADDKGESRNPDGWGEAGPKTTRVTITHGHIGQPTVRD